MIRRCKKSDELVLLDYLREEPVFHTFILADMKGHGFEQEYQDVYMQVEEGNCCGVFLRYYNNFILAGEAKQVDYKGLLPFVTKEITTIMGESSLVQGLCEKLDGKQSYTEKIMYTLPDFTFEEELHETRVATIKDVDAIFEFLMEIPQFTNIYKEKDMISNRIQNNEGFHVIIEKEGKIIAHGNSAAATDITSMIGGIGVRKENRNQGYAKKIVSKICDELSKTGKLPCIFADIEPEYTIFSELGFQKYGYWGVAQIVDNREREL